LLGQVLTGAAVAILCGLDRVAILQVMLSRPIVAAPLIGLLLGDGLIGLEVGVMVELLWLARLPVGATIPPDDTQIAVATTVLTHLFSRTLPDSGPQLVVLCLLLALPCGKLGQVFERGARQYNTRLQRRAAAALATGKIDSLQWTHLQGVLSFALAALLSYAVIVAAGFILVPPFWSLFKTVLGYSQHWLTLVFPLVGIAVILGTVNVSRAITLFCAAYGMAYLLLWLV
jgi:PTS system mannose-specific IIC component